MPSGGGLIAWLSWRLDRLERSLRYLILLLDELSALGVSFVSLQEGIDATTPAGRLQLPRQAAKQLGIPRSTLQRWLAQKHLRAFA